MVDLDHFLHDLPPLRLQWPHAASRQEPHAFVSVAAVKSIDPVAGNRVMEGGSGVLGDESEERLPPRIIDMPEELFPKLLEFFNADDRNGLGNGFAAVFVEPFRIEFLEGHIISVC